MSVIKIIVISIICLLSLVKSTDEVVYYTPEALVEIKSKGGELLNLYDPLDLLNQENISQMGEITDRLKTNRGFDVFVYVFPFMDRKFGNDKDKDIVLFSNDLSKLKLKEDEQKDKKSIFIVFAMEDRQSRIRTGEEVRSYLQDKKCSEFLSDIKPNLKSKNYNAAIYSLLQSIEIRIMTEYQWLTDFQDYIKEFFIDMFYTLIVGLVLIFVVIVIAIVIATLNETRLTPKAEDKLKKIKDITRNGKPRREIIESVCVICLDEIEETKEKQESHTNLNNELSKSVNSIPEIELINKENKKQLEDENLVNKEKDENNFVAKLECGHKFHSKCISEWMVKNNKCPVCREKIEKEDETSQPDQKPSSTSTSDSTNTLTNTFTRSLVNIQTSIHPELRGLDYTFGTSDFSWSRIRPRQTSSKSSSSGFKWGFSSGGSSSRW